MVNDSGRNFKFKFFRRLGLKGGKRSNFSMKKNKNWYFGINNKFCCKFSLILLVEICCRTYLLVLQKILKKLLEKVLKCKVLVIP